MITITTVELLQKSIDYIEENLKTDITITEIAQQLKTTKGEVAFRLNLDKKIKAKKS